VQWFQGKEEHLCEICCRFRLSTSDCTSVCYRKSIVSCWITTATSSCLKIQLRFVTFWYFIDTVSDIKPNHSYSYSLGRTEGLYAHYRQKVRRLIVKKSICNVKLRVLSVLHKDVYGMWCDWTVLTMSLDRSAVWSVSKLWTSDERIDSKQRDRPDRNGSKQEAVSAVRVCICICSWLFAARRQFLCVKVRDALFS